MEINSNLLKRESSQHYKIGSKCNDRILRIKQVSVNNYNIIDREVIIQREYDAQWIKGILALNHANSFDNTQHLLFFKQKGIVYSNQLHMKGGNFPWKKEKEGKKGDNMSQC